MSIGPVSSTSRFSGRLRSINLRPITRGPESGSGSTNQGTNQSSNTSNSSPRSEGSERTGLGQNETTGSNSGPTSDPQRRFSLIGGQSESPSSPDDGGETGQSADTEGPVPGNQESVGPTDSEDLSPSERRKVQELKQIDAKVRSHEQAHLAAAGQYAQGGISFETKTGPDGEDYAVAGEVSLDTSKADSPQETVQKMRQVKAAALAPAEPSPQDQSIAAQASRRLNQARQELQSEETEGQPSATAASESSEGPSSSSGFERPGDFGASSSDREDDGRAVAASDNPLNQYLTGPSASNSSQQPGRALNVLV